MDTGRPPFRYDARLASEIELRWQDRWEREGTFHAANPTGALSDGALSAGFGPEAGRPKFYLLDFFPYPSGAGLHVGPEALSSTSPASHQPGISSSGRVPVSTFPNRAFRRISARVLAPDDAEEVPHG
jgi:hypothetical protein